MKIVVLGGGISTERDVSLSSSRMIYRALKKNGHQAVLLDVYLGYEGSEEEIAHIFEKDCDWAENIGGIQESNPGIGKIRAMRKDGGKSYFGPNVLTVCGMADAVFLGLHGEDGENGKVQAAFDLLGIRYTGRIMSAPLFPWIRAWRRSCSRSTGSRPRRAYISESRMARRLPG